MTRQTKDDYVNIGPPTVSPDGSGTGLTSFQKRLVHQTIESEYPQLITRGKRTFVQIEQRNDNAESLQAASHQDTFTRQVIDQVGLRWIIEALAGGNISRIDPMLCARDIDGNPVLLDVDLCKRQLFEIEEILQRKQPVLVGHNLFTDLIYLHTQFIGPLDDSVEDFQESIHRLFPLWVVGVVVSTNCYSVCLTQSTLRLRSKIRPLDPLP
jgi:poly(A)-specific ribonuclease